jgi:hypothetical protein
MSEVKPYEDRWGLYIDGQLLATSKARCDADAAKIKLDRYIATQILESGTQSRGGGK